MGSERERQEECVWEAEYAGGRHAPGRVRVYGGKGCYCLPVCVEYMSCPQFVCVPSVLYRVVCVCV